MRYFFPICIICGSLFAAGPSFSQLIPENQAFNQHRFFSAPAGFRGMQRIFYQVCNGSGNKSAFRWEGAGFGVSAFAYLEPNVCATKDSYTDSKIAVVPFPVKFERGGSSPVMTWVPCASIIGSNICKDSLAKFAYAPYSIVQAMVNGPSGTVSLSAISILLNVSADGSAKITISASDAFEKVVIALPEASIDIDELRELVSTADAGVDISIGRFEELRGNKEQESNLLTSDILDNTAAISFPPRKSSSEVTFSVREMAKLGKLVVTFGEVGDQISLRNDLVVPLAQ